MARLINQKKKMARKMMTLYEIRYHISPFNCTGWQIRSEAKRDKVLSKKKDDIKIKKITK